jgi:hypothetical protein
MIRSVPVAEINLNTSDLFNNSGFMLKKAAVDIECKKWIIEIANETSPPGFIVYNIYVDERFYDCIIWDKELNQFELVGNYDKDDAVFKKLIQIIKCKFHS